MPKKTITIQTNDGVAPAAIFRPDGDVGPLPGVIFYMDAIGIRPAMDEMANRLASNGFVVLLPDLFYRHGPYGPFDGGALANDEAVRSQVFTLMRETSHEMTRRDTAAFIDALDAEGISGAVGTVGYCMGGARALAAAGSYPERVNAIASFHGGNLASDAEDSPHLLVPQLKARVYVGAAGVDNSFPPEQSTRLADALRRAEVDFTIENYVGASHGWTVPDQPVFNAPAAERHWKRLTAFFSEALQ